MPLTIETVYENGVLKPSQPLPLQEHQRVRLTLATEPDSVDKTYGLVRWTGGLETLDLFITDPELDPLEGP
jgi:predicted DNA-binding antitoxin AbrB/MazE fold protein